MTKTIEELAIKVGLDPITSSQGKPVAWRQTVHVEEVGIKSIKYLYNDEKIMVDDDPLYLAPPCKVFSFNSKRRSYFMNLLS